VEFEPEIIVCGKHKNDLAYMHSTATNVQGTGPLHQFMLAPRQLDC
jgi:hypothetical protein